MKNKFFNVLFMIYVVIAVFTTVCLLSFNEFKVSVFGDTSLVLVTDDALLPDYKKGDLVIVDKNSLIETGEKVFFYESSGRSTEIKLGEIKNAERVNENEITYTFDGDHLVSSSYILGSARGASVIPYVANVLAVLESKWGFLFLIVLPALIAFIHQITVVYYEIKAEKKAEKAENK